MNRHFFYALGKIKKKKKIPKPYKLNAPISSSPSSSAFVGKAVWRKQSFFIISHELLMFKFTKSMMFIEVFN